MSKRDFEPIHPAGGGRKRRRSCVGAGNGSHKATENGEGESSRRSSTATASVPLREGAAEHRDFRFQART